MFLTDTFFSLPLSFFSSDFTHSLLLTHFCFLSCFPAFFLSFILSVSAAFFIQLDSKLKCTLDSSDLVYCSGCKTFSCSVQIMELYTKCLSVVISCCSSVSRHL
jgi:hypothetical protein